jgi:hypothetical protein
LSDDVNISQLIKVYSKINTALKELVSEYEKKEAELNKDLNTVRVALLDKLKELGVDSLKTDLGVVYRTVVTKYWTNDWTAFGKFVVENNLPELLEKRLNQRNMKQFREENPDIIPPGLNTNSSYKLTVRPKTGEIHADHDVHII